MPFLAVRGIENHEGKSPEAQRRRADLVCKAFGWKKAEPGSIQLQWFFQRGRLAKVNDDGQIVIVDAAPYQEPIQGACIVPPGVPPEWYCSGRLFGFAYFTSLKCL
jgi:hypothetical protein